MTHPHASPSRATAAKTRTVAREPGAISPTTSATRSSATATLPSPVPTARHATSPPTDAPRIPTTAPRRGSVPPARPATRAPTPAHPTASGRPAPLAPADPGPACRSSTCVPRSRDRIVTSPSPTAWSASVLPCSMYARPSHRRARQSASFFLFIRVAGGAHPSTLPKDTRYPKRKA